MVATIIIKIGSNCLVDEKKKIKFSVLKSLINQVIKIKKEGYNVIIVSSGAASFGKNVYGKNYLDITTDHSRHMFSSLGQFKLMNTYLDYAKKKNFCVSQILVTKQDLIDSVIYNNIEDVVNGINQLKSVIPIFNENDAIAVNGLRFIDNDELVLYLSRILKPQKVIFLTSVDGVLDDNQLIRSINYNDNTINRISFFNNTTHGTGGMLNKLKICYQLSEIGIMSHIYNGNRDKCVLNVINNHHKHGTTIYPRHNI